MKNAFFAILPLLIVFGCGSSSPEPLTNPGAAEFETTTGGDRADAGRCLPPGPGYDLTEYDTSGDEVADVRKLFKTMGEGSLSRLVLVCREADLNGNGSKDIVRFYTDEGRPKREEADRNFDGRIDEITRFSDGRISLQELDTTSDGVIDTKIFYEEGQPVRAERDMKAKSTGGEWRPDRWEYYADGQLVRIGVDLNGDGKVDRWDRDEEKLRNSALALQPDAAVSQ